MIVPFNKLKSGSTMEHRTTKLFALVLGFLLFFGQSQAQEVKAFYDTRVINFHSIHVNPKGELKFIISHRFSKLNSGAYNLFGLDNSTIRMGFDYGLTDRITIGLGRNSFKKTYDGFVKYQLLRPQKSSPLGITFLAGTQYQTIREGVPENFQAIHRLSYHVNIIFAYRFNDRFSLQVGPSLFHQNLVERNNLSNDLLFLQCAGRVLLSKHWAFNIEYSPRLIGQQVATATQALSASFDWETKGHVFQFQFSNSRGMVDGLVYGETVGTWSAGDIHYGFNISRDFPIKRR